MSRVSLAAVRAGVGDGMGAADGSSVGSGSSSRLPKGDESTAENLFRLHSEHLLALVRRELSTRFSSRFDPEDIVQSAFRSFFRSARVGSELRRAEHLWRLLMAITLNKLRAQIRRHQRGKRDRRREVDWPRGSPEETPAASLRTPDPSPDKAAMLAEEMEKLLGSLTPLNHRIFEMRLQGADVPQIATSCQRSERTVRRVLEQIKERLEQRLDDASRD